MWADILSAFVRAMSFIALFQAAGAAMFLTIFGRQLAGASSPIRRVGFVSAIFGLALVSFHFSLEAARMAGAFSGVLDLSLQRLVFDSPISIAWGLRTAGLTMIAVAINREGSGWTSVSIMGAVLAIIAFLLVGHTAADSERGWLAILLSMHLAIVAFWFGALAPLHIISRREDASVAANVIDQFSRIAVWIVPGIFMAGVVLATMLIERWAVFGESYGLLLLAKAAGFALLMGLATLNKWRYGPKMVSSLSAAVAFQRTVVAEYLLICAVLSITAIMTTFFSPES